MRILITGGAGYIGTVLVEALLTMADDYDIEKITVLDNLLYKQDGLFPLLRNPLLHFVYGDVRDYRKLDPLMQEADFIIPLAAIVGAPACDKDPKLADEINHRQLYYLAENAPYNARIIVPNTNSGYGVGEDGKPCTEESPLNPLSVYGKTKCLGEQRVLDKGNGIALRLATVFGTSYRFRRDLLVNDFVWKAVTDSYIVLFESHFKRNFIHIRDVVDAILVMIREFDVHKGQVFNVGLSSANLSKLELCQAIQKHLPKFVIKQDEFTQDFDKRNYIVSNDKLEATGWSPHFSLDEGIQELIKSYAVLKNTNTQFTNL